MGEIISFSQIHKCKKRRYSLKGLSKEEKECIEQFLRVVRGETSKDKVDALKHTIWAYFYNLTHPKTSVS